MKVITAPLVRSTRPSSAVHGGPTVTTRVWRTWPTVSRVQLGTTVTRRLRSATASSVPQGKYTGHWSPPTDCLTSGHSQLSAWPVSVLVRFPGVMRGDVLCLWWKFIHSWIFLISTNLYLIHIRGHHGIGLNFQNHLLNSLCITRVYWILHSEAVEQVEVTLWIWNVGMGGGVKLSPNTPNKKKQKKRKKLYLNLLLLIIELFLSRFYCREYASSGTPDQGDQADECPTGHFCPTGSAEPEKCPAGTFNNVTRLTELSQCLNCTPGKTCIKIIPCCHSDLTLLPRWPVFCFFLNCFYSWNTGFGIAGLPPQPTSRYIPQYAAVV